MKKENGIKYRVDSNVLNNYVETMRSIKIPIGQIKDQLKYIPSLIERQSRVFNESLIKNQVYLEQIFAFENDVKELTLKYPNDKSRIYTDIIKQIMISNNGILSTRMIEPLNISREYISIMERNKDIERVSRGIYILTNTFEDSYVTFQQKYKKTIFSHMNALYFHGLTEEFPYVYTITVPQSYHIVEINEKCNVFYVSNEIYEMGIIEVETPNGNKIKAYDKERCICDIIRSKNRMDLEQIKKTVKQYMQCNDKDIAKLSIYSKKMGINKKVMEFVGYYE